MEKIFKILISNTGAEEEIHKAQLQKKSKKKLENISGTPRDAREKKRISTLQNEIFESKFDENTISSTKILILY